MRERGGEGVRGGVRGRGSGGGGGGGEMEVGDVHVND